jgi:hypothetical protein
MITQVAGMERDFLKSLHEAQIAAVTLAHDFKLRTSAQRGTPGLPLTSRKLYKEEVEPVIKALKEGTQVLRAQYDQCNTVRRGRPGPGRMKRMGGKG